MKHSFALIFCLLAASLLNAFTLTKSIEIRISREALPAEKRSAHILQDYLLKITGNKLPINVGHTNKPHIAIGKDLARKLLPKVDFSSFGPEESLCQTANNSLALAGKTPRGTLYAVLAFLEDDLGVRFYAPDCELIPSRRNITLKKLNRRFSPAFPIREVYAQTTYRDPLFMAKLHLNGSMYCSQIPQELGGNTQYHMSHTLGIDFLPRETWFPKHPEFFAWRKQEKKRLNTQLCLGNPNVRKEVVRQVKQLLDREPARNFVCLGYSDNNQLCQCNDCEALYKKHDSYGAGLWLTANDVARAIRSEHPRVRIMVQAYWTSERPPENLRLEPQVCVALAMIDRNHGLPPSATARHDVYLRRYNQLTHNQVYTWDYYANFTNFLLPLPNTDVIPLALKTYQKFELNGGFFQLPFGTLADFLDYRVWITAQCLRNPQRNPQALRQDFFRDVYGKAATTMLAYQDRLHRARDRKPVFIGCYGEATKHWLQPADILELHRLWQIASKQATGTSAARHVRKVRASLLTVTLLRWKEFQHECQLQKHTCPKREDSILELERLGREFQCTSWREWNGPFQSLIQRFRTHDDSPPLTSLLRKRPTTLPGNELKASGLVTPGADHALALHPKVGGRLWMDVSQEGFVHTITDEQAGLRTINLRLRAVTDSAVPDAAYAGIYAPHEVCRIAIAARPGKSNYQNLKLGPFWLPQGSKVWIVPGVIAPVSQIEVASLTIR